MKKLDSYSSFHYIFNNGILSGISGTYIDDLLLSGDSAFKEISKRTEKPFDMKSPNSLSYGFNLNFNNDSILVQTHTNYTNKFQKLEIDAPFIMLCSMGIRLAWFSHTRPDLPFKIWRMVHITEEPLNATKPTCIKP